MVTGKSSLVIGRPRWRHPRISILSVTIVARPFLRGTILPEDLQPSPYSFYGHQSARYVDRPRFATCSSKDRQPNPLCLIARGFETHARTHACTRTRMHVCTCVHDRIVRATCALPSIQQTIGNPGYSPSTCSRLKSDRIGQRPGS